MAKSIIMELADGSTCYTDKIRVSDNEEYDKWQTEYNKNFEKLCALLPEDEKRKVLQDLDVAQGSILCVYAEEYFKAGFKLGLSLAAQNLLDD